MFKRQTAGGMVGNAEDGGARRQICRKRQHVIVMDENLQLCDGREEEAESRKT